VNAEETEIVEERIENAEATEDQEISSVSNNLQLSNRLTNFC
jgi:hypothetical protein